VNSETQSVERDADDGKRKRKNSGLDDEEKRRRKKPKKEKGIDNSTSDQKDKGCQSKRVGDATSQSNVSSPGSIAAHRAKR